MTCTWSACKAHNSFLGRTTLTQVRATAYTAQRKARAHGKLILRCVCRHRGTLEHPPRHDEGLRAGRTAVAEALVLRLKRRRMLSSQMLCGLS